MSQHYLEEEFRELTNGFLEGKITRRRFIRQAAKLGFSAVLLSRVIPGSFAANENLVDSSPLNCEPSKKITTPRPVSETVFVFSIEDREQSTLPFATGGHVAALFNLTLSLNLGVNMI